MRCCRDIVLAATLAALGAGRVEAASSLSSSGAALTPPPAARASALVAWRPRAWNAPVAGSVRAAGLRVAIDPVDGTLGMPTVAVLSSQADFADEAPVRVTLRPNGSGRAQLDDRWANFAVVSLDGDGLPVWACVHGSRVAARFMLDAVLPCDEPPATAAAPRVDK